jgi:hypothetical protein
MDSIHPHPAELDGDQAYQGVVWAPACETGSRGGRDIPIVHRREPASPTASVHGHSAFVSAWKRSHTPAPQNALPSSSTGVPNTARAVPESRASQAQTGSWGRPEGTVIGNN